MFLLLLLHRWGNWGSKIVIGTCQLHMMNIQWGTSDSTRIKPTSWLQSPCSFFYALLHSHQKLVGESTEGLDQSQRYEKNLFSHQSRWEKNVHSTMQRRTILPILKPNLVIPTVQNFISDSLIKTPSLVLGFLKSRGKGRTFTSPTKSVNISEHILQIYKFVSLSSHLA